jgi:putative tryptophan/tyrosine transport system substrate-binding protein
MRRREFIAGLGGAAAWPAVAQAQQGERARKIGVLFPDAENDYPFLLQALRDGLQRFGWIEGRNIDLDIRYAGVDADGRAAELVRATPEVIVVAAGGPTMAMKRRTQAIPIVFVGPGDPLATGIVSSLSHPENNLTGIANNFATIGGKWVDLLKDAVPSLTRIGIAFSQLDANMYSFNTLNSFIENAATVRGITIVKLPYRDAVEIERTMNVFASESKSRGGLIALPPGPSPDIRKAINRTAAQHHIPTMYQSGVFVEDDGLIAYGPDFPEMLRQAGDYVDRILRGAKPGDLPVEYPTRFELVINLKTAKALGLTIPPSLLAVADEVIE